MRIRSTILAALLLTAASTNIALAGKDKPGADWIQADQVRQKLMDGGYSSIAELEADDGHWEGEGVKNGVKLEFHVDPKTGAITKERPDKD